MKASNVHIYTGVMVHNLIAIATYNCKCLSIKRIDGIMHNNLYAIYVMIA